MDRNLKPSKIITLKDLVLKFDQLINGEHHDSYFHKCSEKSSAARQAGSKLFTSEKHDKETHVQILSLYTKSIAFAEGNSEELALGYERRSALLIHLKKYKECLIDIERACKITKSDEMKKKLAARKQDCLLQLGKVKKVKQKPPLINFKPSKEIPCASELVKLEYNEKYGRHVVAAEDIKPGTVIAVEKGFLLFPEMKNLYLNCSHCLSLTWTGIPCQSCTVAVYCSKNCKEEAWEQYHDIECSVLPCFDFLENLYGGMEATALTVRLFIKLIKSEGLENIIREANIADHYKDIQLQEFFYKNLFQCNKFQSIYNLSSNEQNVYENNILCKKVIELLNVKSKIFHKTGKDLHSEVIDQSMLSCALKIFEKLRKIARNNTFTFETYYDGIHESQGMDFGAIIGIFCSLFNHNCYCNVNRLFTNNQEILLITTNWISKGQQLFINYGTTDSMTKKERHEYLHHFNFVCDCQACEENYSLIPDIQNLDNMDYEMFLEFDQFHLMKTFSHIVEGSDRWLHTKKSLDDVNKIIDIIHKYHSGLKAYGSVYLFVEYITDYYKKLYAVKHNIPDNC